MSDNQNININDSSSNIAAKDSNTMTTEQAASMEERDLLTTMDPAESKPATTELVIGTWNI